jgi:translation initiation factor 2 alpha subunit (eIF-2alpha)
MKSAQCPERKENRLDDRSCRECRSHQRVKKSQEHANFSLVIAKLEKAVSEANVEFEQCMPEIREEYGKAGKAGMARIDAILGQTFDLGELLKLFYS